MKNEKSDTSNIKENRINLNESLNLGHNNINEFNLINSFNNSKFNDMKIFPIYKY